MRLLQTSLSILALTLLANCTKTSSEYSTTNGRYGPGAYGNDPSSNIFINEGIIDSVNTSNSRIVIDLSDQRARLYKGQELAIETPISTGMKGKETPTGSYHILEKKRVKDSNLYGIWVDGESGALVERDGDSRYRPSGGAAQFQGAPMPFWLKVTPGGAGMHVGYVSQNPVSHGCIRVPQRAQALIFEKAAVGTPVTIRS